MIIDCVSDLHGYYPKLEGGDLLIVAGDLTARHSPIDYGHFAAWIDLQKYTKKVLVAGNHDTLFENAGFNSIQDGYSDINVEYLCDSGTEFEGLKIWGCPWSLWFPGINPKCTAFTCKTEEELKEKWDLIPNNTDILITHCPPRGIRDFTKSKKFAGSKTLVDKLLSSSVKLHVFGHIHECGGQDIFHEFGRKYVNASLVNEYYEHVNEPIRVIL